MKKLPLLGMIVLFTFFHSAYAYVIDQNLTIENKTNLPLYFEAQPPKGQANVTKYIHPHETVEIAVSNGDHTGWLYQPSTATFTIKDAGSSVEYIRGRIAFYIGSAVWNKWSFLDSVSAGAGVNLDQTYSCKNGGNNYVFPHKLVIDGNPEGAAPGQTYTDQIRCEGLQSGSLRNAGHYYDVTCHDKSSATLMRDCAGIIVNGVEICLFNISYKDGNGNSYGIPALADDGSVTPVNRFVGTRYCESWEK